MSNLDYVVSSDGWVLVYDSSVTGDFNGFAQVVNGTELSIYIGPSLPGAVVFGAMVGGSPRHLAINAVYGDKLYARRRGNTAMLSLMADSGWSQVVGGAAAVGTTPTVPPVGVSGIDGSGLKRSLLTDTSGRLQPGDLPVLTNTGTIGSISDGATLAIPTGYKTAEAWLTTGNLSASVVIFFSFDGGSTYPAQGTAKRLDTASVANGLVITGTNVVGKAIRATIPVGATHARVGVSSYTSGSSDAVIALMGAAHTIQVTADAVLGASTAKVGFIAASGIPIIETSTPLSGAGTFSGAVRDTWAVASGSTFNSSASYHKTFAAAAGSDVAGTLYIVGNNDNGVQFYPVASAAASQFGLGGNYSAAIKVDCAYRYMKAYYVNGAGAQARFTLSAVSLAN